MRRIINPSDGERKINESILLRLQDKITPMIINFQSGNDEIEQKSANAIRNYYCYEVKNNNNNIFSISYDRFTTFGSLGLPHLPQKCSSFCDTFYKDTGERLQLEDILKGTKEDIENIMITACDTKLPFTTLSYNLIFSIHSRPVATTDTFIN